MSTISCLLSILKQLVRTIKFCLTIIRFSRKCDNIIILHGESAWWVKLQPTHHITSLLVQLINMLCLSFTEYIFSQGKRLFLVIDGRL